MFHDTFGHVPPLMNPEFAAFMKRFGEIGVALRGREEHVLALQRLYWFFVEFGFVEEQGRPMAFGAGIMSSFGETQHAWNLRTDLRKFTMEGVYHDGTRRPTSSLRTSPRSSATSTPGTPASDSPGRSLRHERPRCFLECAFWR